MRGNQKELRIVAAPLNCPLHAAYAASKGVDMAKGQQRANKEAKKPKKDTSPPKPVGTGGIEPVRTITTAVIPRGKLKNK
jgi:hypothetical protein